MNNHRGAPDPARGRTRAPGLRLSWAHLLCLFPFGVLAAGPDANVILDGWIAAQAEIKTWTAGFIQTRSLKTLSQPLTTAGRMTFSVPDRFRWELGDPAKTIALRNSDEMWVIYPRLKRAERYPLTGQARGEWRELLALLDAGFPKDRPTFDARFKLISIAESNRCWQLSFQPAHPTARKALREIRVTLDTNSFRLAANELVFADGSSMRNEFTNTLINAVVDPELFRWTQEPGYSMAEPMGK